MAEKYTVLVHEQYTKDISKDVYGGIRYLPYSFGLFDFEDKAVDALQKFFASEKAEAQKRLDEFGGTFESSFNVWNFGNFVAFSPKTGNKQTVFLAKVIKIFV
jgi:hypothetical protein